MKTEVKAEVKSEQQAEQKAEAKQERKPREPQMITANGEKVSHGHAFQSTTNPADWYFTAKIDGVQLKPQKMPSGHASALLLQRSDGYHLTGMRPFHGTYADLYGCAYICLLLPVQMQK